MIILQSAADLPPPTEAEIFHRPKVQGLVREWGENWRSGTAWQGSSNYTEPTRPALFRPPPQHMDSLQGFPHTGRLRTGAAGDSGRTIAAPPFPHAPWQQRPQLRAFPAILIAAQGVHCARWDLRRRKLLGAGGAAGGLCGVGDALAWRRGAVPAGAGGSGEQQQQRRRGGLDACQRRRRWRPCDRSCRLVPPSRRAACMPQPVLLQLCVLPRQCQRYDI